ncbi:MAG: cytochrome c oxidase subunit II [Deltaproteobacteria bacterium]|nr:cytochrome c oxidase subunit II [Deltaproteobacteria bacterium]
MMGLLGWWFSQLSLPNASNFSLAVDRLYDFIFWLSVVSFLAIVLMMVVFVAKYIRRREGEATPYIEGHTPTEIGVSAGLFVLVMIIFYWGYRDYMQMRTPPAGAMEINVTGRQWEWEFQYQNGRVVARQGSEPPVFVLPRGQNVKLILQSKDVIHSFYIPEFRVKQDVVPGMYTFLWFEPTAVGEYTVYCAEFCGTDHSRMLARARVVEPADYETWQREWELAGVKSAWERQANAAATKSAAAKPTGPETIADQGKALFATKACSACHSVDGVSGAGPTLKAVFGHDVALADGSTVKADENYLRRSLMEPAAQVVKGFNGGVMPTFQGQLKDAEVTALIEYIKTLQ